MVALEEVCYPGITDTQTLQTHTVVALAHTEIEVKLELQVGARLTETHTFGKLLLRIPLV